MIQVTSEPPGCLIATDPVAPASPGGAGCARVTVYVANADAVSVGSVKLQLFGTELACTRPVTFRYSPSIKRIELFGAAPGGVSSQTPTVVAFASICELIVPRCSVVRSLCRFLSSSTKPA